MKQKLDTTTKSIIALNILAFFIQIFMPEGKSSIVAFSIFCMTLSVITIETYVVYGFNKNVWLSSTKLLCYMLAIGVMLYNGGQEFILQPLNIIMIIICVFGLILRWFIKHYEPDSKALVLLYIQNIANLAGSTSYVISVIRYPEHYGIWSIIFWLVNTWGYWIALRHVVKHKLSKANYIFPVFGIVCCLIYIAVIIIMKLV